MTKDLQLFISKQDAIIKNFCTNPIGKMIDRLPEFICELKQQIKKAKRL